MTITQLYAALNAKYPPATAIDGDVDGLQLCFDAQMEVKKVLLTLDVTLATAEYAVAGGFDTVISHHALIRTPLGEVTPHCPNSVRVIALCGGRVNSISLHTRLDTAADGVNACLGKALELKDTTVFYVDSYGAGLVGYLPYEMTASQLAAYGEEKLGTRVAFTNADKPMSKIAICGGGGSFCLPVIASLGVDAFFTGELKHGEISTYAPFFPIFIAGHHETERVVLPSLAKTISEIDSNIYTEIFDSGQVSWL